MNRRLLIYAVATALMALGLAGPVPSLECSLLTPNPDLVPCTCYPDIVVAGALTGSQGQAQREFLFKGQQLRIREDGMIERVEFYVNDLADTDGVYVTIWRRNEDGSGYARVGESENLISRLVAGQVNEVDLESLIDGVLTGDYFGVRLTQSGDSDVSQLVLRSDVQHAAVLWFDEDPGDNDVDWEHGADGHGEPGEAVPIHLYMQAPVIVAIGDSIVAGRPGNYSFTEAREVMDLTASFPNIVADALSVTVQNMGTGGNTIGQVEERLVRDCVELKPKIAIINGGVNDLHTGKTSKAAFLESWTAILDTCEQNGIVAVVIGILPWSNGSNARMRVRDEWNASLRALVESHDGFAYVDGDPYVGVHREGGDPNNLWDIARECDADGIHFTREGDSRIALAILDAIDETSRQEGSPDPIRESE